MSKILVIGNVLKDVYLKLDERHNDFEKDERDISWLDLCFNGESHPFYQRTAVHGGAAVTLGTLAKLGISAKIMGSDSELVNGEMSWQGEPDGYRYILCHEGDITYFVPSKHKATDWSVPKETPEWILVDRSATITDKLVEEILNFRKLSPSMKLAVYIEKHPTPMSDRLARVADILFVEDEPPLHKEEKIVDKIELGKPTEQLVCHISPRKIILGDAEESWVLSRTDMMTHMTVYNTIVATILGVITAGGNAEDAVLWARLNAEQSTLAGTLSGRKIKELAQEERTKRENVKLITRSLMTPRRGVLVADDSEENLNKKLSNYDIKADKKTQKEYYKILLTAPELASYLSGVVLTEQIARTKMGKSQTYLEYLTGRGIITGVKADQGQMVLEGTEDNYSLGEETLHQRLSRYYDEGFRFAKWQACFEIDVDRPSYPAIRRNAELLSNFAKECQLVGLVPIIESDIAWGGDYSLEKSIEITDRVLLAIFEQLERRRVDPTTVILRTSMVMAGKESAQQSTPREIGIATAGVLKHALPRYLAGVLLLDSGQEPNVATKNLLSVQQSGPFDWPISFAFSSALQDSLMMAWKGETKNIDAAQAAFRRHLQDNVAVIK